ncbi:MAG: glycosyltransferase family 2 protein [Bacteroidales bacterium]|nr:glycosyltransferase family 2 protein [Melioribacteraceae bacterium]MCF8398619.1 glycosyltransferase family 2 protein [Bacteroidales bacterium]
MLHNKTIAVVVPAYNEETQIGQVIETMPEFVDRIIIVNDKSNDKTAEVVKHYIEKDNGHAFKIPSILNNIKKSKYNHADWVVQEQIKKEIEYFIPSEVVNKNQESESIILINHLKNGGVGAAIARGYKWAKDYGIECTAVMAGDGQMDPTELESICRPVVEDGIDYVKGNRLIHRSSWLVIPKVRFFGNSILSILTKIASGYWHVSDTQTGYTAISNKALNSIRIHKIYKSYGMPNDIMVKLNIAMNTLKEVEIKPVYDVGEKSKMKVGRVIPRISWLLFKSFFKRLWIKYLFRDFHPLFLLYHISFILFFVSLPFLYLILQKVFIPGQAIVSNNLIVFIFLIISSFQSLLFAMWMDIQDNERLYK